MFDGLDILYTVCKTRVGSASSTIYSQPDLCDKPASVI